MSRPVADFDAFVAECPTRDLLARLGSKWVSLILVALADGSLGYRALHRRIDGVSQKMLTQTLRALERDGLVGRTEIPTVPIGTDYALTDLGRSLLPIVAALKTWAETHMAEIADNRADHDRHR